MSPKCFILDSYAIISVLLEQPGYKKVVNLLESSTRGECKLYMTTINWGEVYYHLVRRKGERAANTAIAYLEAIQIELVEATQQRVLNAAKIKARYPVSYADAFAVAAAQEFACSVVTGDPEFQRVTHLVGLLWLADD